MGLNHEEEKPVKNIVKLVSTTTTDGELAITVSQCGNVRGTYFMPRGESVVENALLLLGYSTVHLDGEGKAPEHYSLSNPRGKLHANALPAPSLGRIHLTRRWSEPLEEYRLDIDVEGRKYESVDSRMNLGTLRRILVNLGFTVSEVAELDRLAA
jgi:hypothetical protein